MSVPGCILSTQSSSKFTVLNEQHKDVDAHGPGAKFQSTGKDAGQRRIGRKFILRGKVASMGVADDERRSNKPRCSWEST